MDDANIRALIEEHYRSAGIDEAKVHEIYSDEAILDFPQGGERIRGKANIFAFRSAYPAKVAITPRRIVGTGNLWVHEGTITYDGKPNHTIAVLEFVDGKVVHETVYITESWEPPSWRAQWVEPMTASPSLG